MTGHPVHPDPEKTPAETISSPEMNVPEVNYRETTP